MGWLLYLVITITFSDNKYTLAVSEGKVKKIILNASGYLTGQRDVHDYAAFNR